MSTADCSFFVIIYTFKVFNADDINEDRMIALRKRAEVDTKYVIFVKPNDASDLSQSLHRHFPFLAFPPCFCNARALVCYQLEKQQIREYYL